MCSTTAHGGSLLQLQPCRWPLTPLAAASTPTVSSQADLREKLAKMYDVKDLNCVFVFGMRTQFGGGKSSGFGLIYGALERVPGVSQPQRACWGEADATAGGSMLPLNMQCSRERQPSSCSRLDNKRLLHCSLCVCKQWFSSMPRMLMCPALPRFLAAPADNVEVAKKFEPKYRLVRVRGSSGNKGRLQGLLEAGSSSGPAQCFKMWRAVAGSRGANKSLDQPRELGPGSSAAAAQRAPGSTEAAGRRGAAWRSDEQQRQQAVLIWASCRHVPPVPRLDRPLAPSPSCPPAERPGGGRAEVAQADQGAQEPLQAAAWRQEVWQQEVGLSSSLRSAPCAPPVTHYPRA